MGYQKHNGKRFNSLPQNCHIRYSLNPKMGRICVAWVWNRERTEKFVNGNCNILFGSYQNRNERTTSKRTFQFSIGISEKWPYHLPSIRNFRNFLSNGKHSLSTTIYFTPTRKSKRRKRIRIVRGTKERIKLEPFRSFIHFLALLQVSLWMCK